jgi:hypothetical protein
VIPYWFFLFFVLLLISNNLIFSFIGDGCKVVGESGLPDAIYGIVGGYLRRFVGYQLGDDCRTHHA